MLNHSSGHPSSSARYLPPRPFPRPSPRAPTRFSNRSRLVSLFSYSLCPLRLPVLSTPPHCQACTHSSHRRESGAAGGEIVRLKHTGGKCSILRHVIVFALRIPSMQKRLAGLARGTPPVTVSQISQSNSSRSYHGWVIFKQATRHGRTTVTGRKQKKQKKKKRSSRMKGREREVQANAPVLRGLTFFPS